MAVKGQTKHHNPKLARPTNGKHNNKNKKGTKNKSTRGPEIIRAFKKAKFDLEDAMVETIIDLFNNKQIGMVELNMMMPYVWSKRPAESITSVAIDLPQVVFNELKTDKDDEKKPDDV